jgi:hypothetical protein
MKRALNPMGIGAIAVCLVVFVYAFSYPLAAYITLNYLPRDCIPYLVPYLVNFYHPANTIAVRCPPYAAILEWEGKLLRLPMHYSVPPPSSP